MGLQLVQRTARTTFEALGHDSLTVVVLHIQTKLKLLEIEQLTISVQL